MMIRVPSFREILGEEMKPNFDHVSEILDWEIEKEKKKFLPLFQVVLK